LENGWDAKTLGHFLGPLLIRVGDAYDFRALESLDGADVISTYISRPYDPDPEFPAF
jgi:hypothetical protein